MHELSLVLCFTVFIGVSHWQFPAQVSRRVGCGSVRSGVETVDLENICWLGTVHADVQRCLTSPLFSTPLFFEKRATNSFFPLRCQIRYIINKLLLNKILAQFLRFMSSIFLFTAISVYLFSDRISFLYSGPTRENAQMISCTVFYGLYWRITLAVSCASVQMSWL
ncbi:hypothetical protein J3Q64DRAFT_1854495 [Phycomyces blakesleeanus]|uniref:Uncharacterized protein n=2 Tax=Phycomyces blakesleeanus TaxID=4837 RepID=A0A162UTF9_PHYB8|nr:hypothetical protein PHYBLDRAFT_164803 [Phycomyces blakesleeanus NRRL 1555(-)]OAD77922.1 hypothetical protein PHYBLDRAFT_164803 [Phycomyces blakesleeanus NRRL 1555(-)]|eukprot:XP_018295962.1 hypothetical protein PHYBLDRAFT_164803 [Phycomyces blakesleeanus NRRL 1555(-)]